MERKGKLKKDGVSRDSEGSSLGDQNSAISLMG